MSDEAEGGVGGFAGMKNDGIVATDDFRGLVGKSQSAEIANLR